MEEDYSIFDGEDFQSENDDVSDEEMNLFSYSLFYNDEVSKQIEAEERDEANKQIKSETTDLLDGDFHG